MSQYSQNGRVGKNHVLYSKLFGKLVNSRWKLDDTMTSFLYYLFPRDLFVRALSLLDSGNMFIYLLEIDGCGSSEPSVVAEQKSVVVEGGVNGSELKNVVKSLYDPESTSLSRLIVKSSADSVPPIYVDLNSWLCSCEEYSEQFLETLESCSSGKNQDDQKLSSILLDIKNDVTEFSDDKFAQIDAHSLSKQYYIEHNKLMCPHLLAYSILLASSERTCSYFATKNPTVVLLKITNLDEWLRLHINIVS